MTDKRDVKSIKDLILENEQLQFQIDNQKEIINEMEQDYNALIKQNQSLRFTRGQLYRELQRIKGLSMFEFANEFCNDNELEEAGRNFARSLLGKPMTPKEVAVDEAENRYDYYKGDDF